MGLPWVPASAGDNVFGEAAIFASCYGNVGVIG